MKKDFGLILSYPTYLMSEKVPRLLSFILLFRNFVERQPKFALYAYFKRFLKINQLNTRNMISWLKTELTIFFSGVCVCRGVGAKLRNDEAKRISTKIS